MVEEREGDDQTPLLSGSPTAVITDSVNFSEDHFVEEPRQNDSQIIRPEQGSRANQDILERAELFTDTSQEDAMAGQATDPSKAEEELVEVQLEAALDVRQLHEEKVILVFGLKFGRLITRSVFLPGSFCLLSIAKRISLSFDTLQYLISE